MQDGDPDVYQCDFAERDSQHSEDQVRQQGRQMLEKGVADATCHHGDGQCPVPEDSDGRRQHFQWELPQCRRIQAGIDTTAETIVFKRCPLYILKNSRRWPGLSILVGSVLDIWQGRLILDVVQYKTGLLSTVFMVG